MAGRKKVANFAISNRDIKQVGSKRSHHKCAHHANSYNYSSNVSMHNQIVNDLVANQVQVDMTTPINATIAFHFLAQPGTFDTADVFSRALEVVAVINDDFNNYSTNPRTMNNLKYTNVVSQVFTGDLEKQDVYLSEDYLDVIPEAPSNITFELGEIYYYPVTSLLNLAAYDDINEIELEYQAIRQFISRNQAFAIRPDNFLNIWIVDMVNTDILGFSNFPWEVNDLHNGIIINRIVFFPEELVANGLFFPYDRFKTFSHEIGHYFGLLHIFNNDNDNAQYAAVNINEGEQVGFDGGGQFTGDYIADTPIQFQPTYDPTDILTSRELLTNPDYNPLFMNFMDYTYDKYLTNFTYNQIQKMRYMIFTYRPGIVEPTSVLPTPVFNPVTNTIIEDDIIDPEFVRRSTEPGSFKNLSYPDNFGKASKYATRLKLNSANNVNQEQKYNKYGQLNTMKENPPPKLQIERPQKRFTRTKPL
uniref:Peptidase M43 pregnancy-associated plasma-A domain-containing protein n=1 Tax=viral metagenome TaxID=1070528 RepID=A0A6C0C5M6_9ZZZZ